MDFLELYSKTDAIDGGEVIFKFVSFEITDTELPGSRKFPTDKNCNR